MSIILNEKLKTAIKDTLNKLFKLGELNENSSEEHKEFIINLFYKAIIYDLLIEEKNEN